MKTMDNARIKVEKEKKCDIIKIEQNRTRGKKMVLVATQIKRRRGTTAENDAFTGAEGEITVDTEKHELRVHDGETQGGHIIPTNETLDFANKALDNLSQEGEARFTGKANSDLSNIPSNIDYVVEKQDPTAETNYTWYRKYKSGWVEQGGIATATQASIVFPVVMADDNYTWNLSILSTSTTSGAYNNLGIQTKTTTGITIYASSTVRKSWQVSGMTAQ